MSIRSILFVAIPAGILAINAPLVLQEDAVPAWAMAYLDPGLPSAQDATRLQTAQTTPQDNQAGNAAPQATTPQNANPGPGWAVNCKSEVNDKGLDCRLSQTVVTQNRQLLTNVTFHFPPPPQKPESIIQVPLGVLLPAAGTIQVDESPSVQFNFRACDRNGCYGQAPLSGDFLAQLKKGKQVMVTFRNLADKEIKVPLSLNGFVEAYGKMPSASG